MTELPPLNNAPWFTPHAVRISETVTWDLWLNNSTAKQMFRLLNKTGDFMNTGTSHKDTHPVTTDRWAGAVGLAEEYGALYIVNYRERTILYRKQAPRTGTIVWLPVCPVYHDSILKLNTMHADRYEPLPDGSQPKRKQPSGAQNRKRYNK